MIAGQGLRLQEIALRLQGIAGSQYSHSTAEDSTIASIGDELKCPGWISGGMGVGETVSLPLGNLVGVRIRHL